MANRHRSFARGKSSSRIVQWLAPSDQAFVNVNTGATTIISSASFEQVSTVMRTRGQVSIIPQDPSADLNIVGAYGACIVSTDAFTAGVASVPAPFDDADWGGWYVWRSFGYRLEVADNTGKNFINWTQEIDSKAMRKITPNETLIFVAQSQVGAYSINMPLRTLLKNP